MSKKSEQLRRRLHRFVDRELAKGTSKDDIIAALEITKCNLAIAAAHVNRERNERKQDHGKNN